MADCLPFRMPRTLHELGLSTPMDAIPLERELRWVSALVLSDLDRIKKFVALSRAFHNCYLRGDDDGVRRALDEIEAVNGWSLWLLRARIVALQAAGGLATQKKAVGEWIEAMPQHCQLAYIVHYLSVRNEPSVNTTRFVTTMSRRIARPEMQADLVSHLQYALIAPPSLLRGSASAVLRQSAAYSLVDAYEALLVVSRSCVLMNEERSVAASVLNALKGAKDERVLPLLWLNSTSVSVPERAPVDEAAEHYLRGRYLQALELASQHLRSQNDCPNSTLVAVRSAALLGNTKAFQGLPAPLSRLLDRAVSVLLKSSTALDDLAEVRRYCMNFSGTALSGTLHALTAEATRDTPAGDVDGGAGHAALLAEPSAARALTLTNDLAAEYRARIRHDRVSSRLLGIVGSDGEEVSLVARADHQLWEACRRLGMGEFGRAMELSLPKVGHSVSLLDREAARLVANILLRSGKALDAIRLVVARCLDDVSSYDMLPIGAAAHLAATMDGENAGEIALPLVLDLYRHLVDADLDSERVFAFSEFLAARGVTRPSELGKSPEPSRNEFLHFLRFVCVERVMARSGLFQSSEEVAKERLAICRRLIELDEGGAAGYRVEMGALLRRLQIERGLREVEQSKIYVDQAGVRRSLSTEMTELFARYDALRAGAPPTKLVILLAIRKEGERDVTAVEFGIPKNETTDLLRTMLVRIMDEFASNPDHGLNKYLSVRVRHGTLAAHLRRCVEAHGLITRRGAGSPDYARNDRWLQRIDQRSPLGDMMSKRLSSFSRAYDDLIAGINGRLQLRSADNDGLFDFSLTTRSVAEVVAALAAAKTVDEFFDRTFQKLDELLDRNLLSVRRYINEVAKPEAIALLDALGNDLSIMSAQQSVDLGELLHEIRTASTELKVDFDALGAWFSRAANLANEPFTLENPIQIAEQLVRVGTTEFAVEGPTELFGEVRVMNGALFSFFVDVFLILFDNVARHSRVSPPRAVLALELAASSLLITVTNRVAPDGRDSDAAKRVENARVAMTRADSSPIAREGGSGLPKLNTLLAYDIGGAQVDHFGFKGDEFEVEFSLPSQEFVNVPKDSVG